MVVTDAADGDDPRPERSHGRTGGSTPSDSRSPAPTSPVPFQPTFESRFTPLSMHSDSGFGKPHTKEEQGTSYLPAAAGAHILSGHAPLSPPLDKASAQGSSNDDNQDNTNHLTPSESNSGSGPGPSRGPTEHPYPSHSTRQPALVHPMPIVRTASTKSVSLCHPTPDFVSRCASQTSNIAQLEATAERLSLTSSIENAIRGLHEEQKRADSRRSSILAASIASIPETDEPAIAFPMSRQISVGSSIRETNTAARHGGYSPAGYIMSPISTVVSNVTRFRSGSVGKSKADLEMGSSLSRHGPGKSSTRSVRSVTKPALTNIAEIEPTTLTAAAMDEADRLDANPEVDDFAPFSTIPDMDLTPNANSYHDSYGHDYWNGGRAEPPQDYQYNSDNARPRTSSGSVGTFEQAERAFAEFDGAHCSPDVDLDDSLNFQSLFASPTEETSFLPDLDLQLGAGQRDTSSLKPRMSPPIPPATAHPKSYLNPETGETMLYYPARVPMMLNLPPKLSKKLKAEVRNNRRSQVLSALPSANRQAVNSWLPELHSEPLLDSLEPQGGDPNSTVTATSNEQRSDSTVDDGQVEGQPSSETRGQSTDKSHRLSRASLMNTDKRGSQIPDMGKLPPQLRASAYFELPSQSPKIKLKDGSATSTLDDILDASATAPVSAFTDHAFAGALGPEVYGTAKKRKSHMKRPSGADLVEPKNRNSIFHLRKLSALSRLSSFPDEGQKSEAGDDHTPGLTSAVDGEPGPNKSGEEDGEGEEDDEEKEPVYNGPPTTLLAELQMRKQQQRQRTRPVASAFPNGMHSTLLDIDTVAELERRARKGKKVNLAWEDPSGNGTEDEDEETPLALLLASKGKDSGLVGALAEMSRPLGLMERRDMEDNEPLSVRRSRLQGREAGPIQRMTLARVPNMNMSSGQPSHEVQASSTEGDEMEADNETLGDRMRRLRARERESANSLPEPRPVSSTFAAELLGQLGDTIKDEETTNGKDAKKDSTHNTTEEEETLGQRRRRLQAEREARERELARVKLNGGRDSVTPQLPKRRSMADVLVSSNNKPLLADPRADAERARQEAAARYRREQEQKFAALRQQMPTNLNTPNLVKAGGFMSGRFNDGAGGGFGQSRKSMAGPATNAGAMGTAFRAGGAMSTWATPMAETYANPYGTPSPAQASGQMDRVERWRQGVQP
ncbi:hypothetical protein F5Y17DRAFT_416658 [Xylariaceae sp. FL0594]|nr:hypothetical protein F5Y17DRAFT_416658 [Xylariaceae sp. FL0594]